MERHLSTRSGPLDAPRAAAHHIRMTGERVLVAMSGGVDSSVAAALLHEAGYDVVGVTLHLWDAEGEQKVGRCCAPEDRDDARRVCDWLGLPHYVLDERAAFRSDVVDPFLGAYLAGETPIPCVACNQSVKLGRLEELADTLGARTIATGHYARIAIDPAGGDEARARLLRGRDRAKDQSYFLFGVRQALLARMRFPLGELTKAEARAEGRRLGVPNADKPDSQALCFVPDGDVGGFVERERPGIGAPGRIVDDTGRVLGEHEGVHRFTVGQRRGLGLGGGATRYVLRIVADTGDVVVGDEPSLMSRRLRARGASWIDRGGGAPSASFDASVRVRYRHEPAPARVTPIEGGFEAEFTEPQRAIARGQAAVVYAGDEVVGGGFIA